MNQDNRYTSSSAGNRPTGFFALLKKLKEDYLSKSAAVCERLDALCTQSPAPAAAQEWKKLLEENRISFSSCLDSCGEMLTDLEKKIRVGQLSLANEQVCADVTETEARVLTSLTALQRLNSEALQPVFTLRLPAVLKTLEGREKALLRDAVSLQTENTQYFSNELQHLAIMLKERNKTITHPLDENHPE